MLFNSIEFLLFLPTVFVLYWFLFKKNVRIQNIFLILASYLFYGWWDWRFLVLIFLSTVVDFLVGQKIYEHINDKQKDIANYFCKLHKIIDKYKLARASTLKRYLTNSLYTVLFRIVLLQTKRRRACLLCQTPDN